MDERGTARRRRTAGRSEAGNRGQSRGIAMRFRRQALGMGALLFTLAPAYVMFREPMAALQAARADQDADVDDGADDRDVRVSILEIEAHIREVAVRHGLSPLLVAAIVEAESDFNPRAVSRKGAQGLMQLMPATASSLRVENAFDPYDNIEGGVRHLRRLMDKFRGDLPLVLAAYNAGENAVIAHRGVPPYRETRRYVRRIMRRIGAHPAVITARNAATPTVVYAAMTTTPLAATDVPASGAAASPAEPSEPLVVTPHIREQRASLVAPHIRGPKAAEQKSAPASREPRPAHLEALERMPREGSREGP